MEISNLPTRPQAPPAPQATAISQPTEPVRTALADTKVVTAVASVSLIAKRSENSLPSQPQSANSLQPRTEEVARQERTRRKTVMDWATNQPVFRVIDERSGQTISQTPDQALLRLRAYVRQQDLVSITKGHDPAA